MAGGNFKYWLSNKGGQRILPNAKFKADRKTNERMAIVRNCLKSAIEYNDCRSKSYEKHCYNISVAPSTTDLAAGLGLFSLNGRLHCFTKDDKAKCTITWSVNDTYDWNKGQGVPGLPGCDIGIIPDNLAQEIEGKTARKFSMKSTSWTETFELPCPKKATASKCCPQGIDPYGPLDDLPPNDPLYSGINDAKKEAVKKKIRSGGR